MSADTRPLKTAEGGKIAPQYYNPLTNQYEYVEGQDGMAKYVAPNTDLELANVKAELEAIKARLNEPLDTQLTGSSVAQPVDLQYHDIQENNPIPVKDIGGGLGSRTEVETVVNAESVAAAGALEFSIVSQGESEVFIAVSIDKQPWKLRSGVPWTPAAGFGSEGTVFMDDSDKQKTHSSAVPVLVYFLGVSPVLISGAVAPTTLDEARRIQIPSVASVGVSIHNQHAADDATVTIRLIRVWR